MNKIEKLESEHQKNMAEKAGLEAKAKEMKGKADALMKQAEQAAEAGDLEAFKKYKALADDAGTAAYVANAQIAAKLRPITREAAADAWKDYSSSMKKSAEAAEKNFLKLRDSMTEAFVSWMETLEDARATRKKLGVLMGLQGDNMETEKNLSAFPIPFPEYDLSPEFKYFVSKLGERGEYFWASVEHGLIE